MVLFLMRGLGEGIRSKVWSVRIGYTENLC
jgi:hypothetical protein